MYVSWIINRHAVSVLQTKCIIRKLLYKSRQNVKYLSLAKIRNYQLILTLLELHNWRTEDAHTHLSLQSLRNSMALPAERLGVWKWCRGRESGKCQADMSIVPTNGAPGVSSWLVILAYSDENVTFGVWIILHLLEVGRAIFTCAHTFKNLFLFCHWSFHWHMGFSALTAFLVYFFQPLNIRVCQSRFPLMTSVNLH